MSVRHHWRGSVGPAGWAMALLAAGALLSGLAPAPAQAVIQPSSTLDGPNRSVLELGGVAMASDGTGGLVYRKLDGGQAHVFASRFVGGQWGPPLRVDTGQGFSATAPRIAAGDGGRLLVVWGEPFQTVNGRDQYALMSAMLDRGAASFGPALVVDPNVGDGSALYPALAMTPSGQADVVYRVITDDLSSGAVAPLRPGDVLMDVRMARLDGATWSALGAINRNPSATMRKPSAGNAPALSIEPSGGGVVAWQEPDTSGVARIWARRLFGATLGNVLEASATSWQGQPIGDDADAPAAQIASHAEADVAYRQTAGSHSPLGGARIFVNRLPTTADPNSAGQFVGAGLADGGAGPPAGGVGPPSVSVDQQAQFRIVFTSGPAADLVSGDANGPGALAHLGPALPGAAPGALTTVDPQGGGTAAWPAYDRQDQPVAGVREDFPTGAFQTAALAGGGGGQIRELALAGSGRGDALVAFRQGDVGAASIVGDIVQAPPAPLGVLPPKGWVRPERAFVSWKPELYAPPVTYSVLLDGQLKVAGLAALAYAFDPHGLTNGVHHVQLVATDARGQETASAVQELKVDGGPPTVHVRVRRRRAVVRVTDRFSGAVAKRTTVSFGDGAQVRGALIAGHVYRHAGRFRVVVSTADAAGNVARFHRQVVVR